MTQPPTHGGGGIHFATVIEEVRHIPSWRDPPAWWAGGDGVPDTAADDAGVGVTASPAVAPASPLPALLARAIAFDGWNARRLAGAGPGL